MAPAKLSHIIKNFALLNKYQFRTGAPATFVRVKIKIVAAKKNPITWATEEGIFDSLCGLPTHFELVQPFFTDMYCDCIAITN
jgi:hypothetical protein